MQLRIKYLEDFGPKKGERLTKQDGKDLKQELEAMRRLDAGDAEKS